MSLLDKNTFLRELEFIACNIVSLPPSGHEKKQPLIEESKRKDLVNM